MFKFDEVKQIQICELATRFQSSVRNKNEKAKMWRMSENHVGQVMTHAVRSSGSSSKKEKAKKRKN